jgi:hypothetical protein
MGPGNRGCRVVAQPAAPPMQDPEKKHQPRCNSSTWREEVIQRASARSPSKAALVGAAPASGFHSFHIVEWWQWAVAWRDSSNEMRVTTPE